VDVHKVGAIPEIREGGEDVSVDRVIVSLHRIRGDRGDRRKTLRREKRNEIRAISASGNGAREEGMGVLGE